MRTVCQVEEVNPPKVVFLNITNACNLRCVHCYFASGKILENELSTKEWFRILDQMKTYGIKKVRINGGEPLVRRDVYEILGHAKKLGLQTTLVTNATLITPQVLDRLKPLLDVLYFSLDGADGAAHDVLRKYEGLFNKVIQSIALARKQDFSVGVFTSVSRVNAAEIQKLVGILDSSGVEQTAFFYCSPFGRARESWRNLFLNPKEWNAVYRRIQREVKRIRPKMKVFIEPRFRKVGEPRDAQCSLWEKDICSVDPQGDVYFCSMMIDFTKKWSLGNLREQPFEEIWEQSPMWDYMKQQKDREVGKRCNGCPRLPVCGGGCTASNLINHTEFLDECGKEYFPICFMKWEEITHG